MKTIQNITFEVVKSGEEAIEILFTSMQDGRLFDLVLMDMIMDGMNGEETTHKIRKLESLFGVQECDNHYICGMKGMLPKDYNMKEGFDDMLEKPVTAEKVAELLKLTRAEGQK